MTMIIIKKVKAIDALFANIDKATGSIVTQISQACVTAAFHALVHGDPIYVNRLVAISKRVAGNKVMRWFDLVAYDVLSYNSKDKAFSAKSKEVRSLIDQGQYEEYLLAAKNYIDLSPDPTFKPFSTVGMLKAIISRYENMKPEDKANEKNNFAGIAKIKALAASLEKSRPETAKAAEAKAKVKAPVVAKKKKKKKKNDVPPAAPAADYIKFDVAVH